MWWMLAGAALQGAAQIGAARGQAAIDKVENQRIAAYNKAVAAQTAKSFNEIALQKTVLSAQVGQAIVASQRQGAQLKSARGLQAAGTDTMGASVEQNLIDVDMKVGEAKQSLMYNAELSDSSLNAQAQSVADSGGMSLRAERPVTNVWGAALGKAIAEVGVSMLESKGETGSFFGRGGWDGSGTSRRQGIR